MVRCPPARRARRRLPPADRVRSLIARDPAELATPGKGDRLDWKWGKGADTQIADFGNPPNDGYLLRVYDAGGIALTTPVAGGCVTKALLVSKPTGGVVFQNRSLQPSGVQSLKLVASVGGKARVVFKPGFPRWPRRLMTIPCESAMSCKGLVRTRRTADGRCDG